MNALIIITFIIFLSYTSLIMFRIENFRIKQRIIFIIIYATLSILLFTLTA